VITVPVPTLHFNCGSSGWAPLLSALTGGWNEPDEIKLLFGNCRFLSAEGAAALAAFSLHRRAYGRRTIADWDTVIRPISKQLGRWGITPLLGGAPFPWSDNAIPLFHQNRFDKEALLVYLSTYMQSGSNIPGMTPAVLKLIRHSLFELFQNVFLHAESRFGGLAIGQFYPNAKACQLCVCDAGIGLADRVERSGLANTFDGGAISWALQKGTSTQGRGVPGGLGLFFLKGIVQKNGGSLRIMANNEYYHLRRGASDIVERLPIAFPGTMILLRLCGTGDVDYTLKPESSPAISHV
jgi:hypothetical protein